MKFQGNNPLVVVDLNAIRHNYSLLRRNVEGSANASFADSALEAGWQPLVPVVKADAYGHGLEAVAGACVDAGCHGFAVGSVEEGARLRTFLERSGEKAVYAPILSLLGAETPDEIALALHTGLTVTLHRPDQIELFASGVRSAGPSARKGNGVLQVALKLDSGMARMGFALEGLLEAVDAVGAHPELKLEVMFSHLSSSDMPSERDYCRMQAARFAEAARAVRGRVPDCLFSLCNSAGTLNVHDLDGLGLEELPMFYRPGIALYGCNPFYGTSFAVLGEALRQSMSFMAPVCELRKITRGDSVGYGRSFKAQRDMWLAVVRCGYADGYSRQLSNGGPVLLGGTPARVAGRVCMQTLMVEIPAAAEASILATPLDELSACLLGRPWRAGFSQPCGEADSFEASQAFVPGEALAERCQTITYEIFCNLGKNKRLYVG